MRRTLTALFAVAAVGLSIGSPARAAEPVKKFTGTIAVPAASLASEFGAGEDSAAVRRTCPSGGEGDGVIYRFFDLKKGYTKFKAYGPTPVVNQPVPSNALAGAIMEYDIDVTLFDKKCNEIDTAGGGDLGGFEQTTAPARNPAYYAVVTYFYGVYPNIEVTLEAS